MAVFPEARPIAAPAAPPAAVPIAPPLNALLSDAQFFNKMRII